MSASAQATHDESRARLFVALDPPDRVRSAIAEWGRAALGDPAFRLARTDALHLTLRFLGSRPEAQIPRLGTIVEGLAQKRVTITLSGPVGKPARRPALYALEAESPAARELQAELVATLGTAGLDSAEARPFWPHLTLARVRSESGHRKGPRRVAAPPGALPQALREPWDAVRVSLYRSYLRPEGAQYVSLATKDLKQEVM